MRYERIQKATFKNTKQKMLRFPLCLWVITRKCSFAECRHQKTLAYGDPRAQIGSILADEVKTVIFPNIRQAFAQGVSEHEKSLQRKIATFCNASQLKHHFRAQDTISSSNFWNLCSSCRSLIRNAHVTGSLWEPSGMSISSWFLARGPFWKPFPELAVCQN